MSDQNENQSRARIIKSDEIFEGSREVLIQHEKDTYRLIITKSGKLVLNK